MLLEQYFEGLHHGNVEKLTAIFHPRCQLQAPGIRRSRDEWLTLVAMRESPAKRGDPFNYRILSIDIQGEQAMAQVDCPLLGSRFTDYLGLLYESGEWKIVNKMYADRIPSQQSRIKGAPHAICKH